MTQCSLLSRRSSCCIAIYSWCICKIQCQESLLASNTKVARVMHCQVLFIPTVSTQTGDSAVIAAAVEQQPAPLRELVRAGSDLNLQNQVRYTVTVDTAPHIIPSCPY